VASEAHRAIEAILMVAEAPVEPGLLAQLLEVSPARVEELCAELEASYRDEDRGFGLVRVAGGYRFQSHGDLAAYVERFVLEGQSAKLSAAALETLAIVAYKQPVSRAQIASIRGVSAEGVLRTLQARGFVAEVGRDPGPGQAVLYGTTPALLERLGLDRIDDLPPLAQFVPGPEVMDALEHSLRPDRLEPGAGEGPAGADGGPAGADDGPAGADDGPAGADDEGPAGADGGPAGADDRSPGAGDGPAGTGDGPAGGPGEGRGAPVPPADGEGDRWGTGEAEHGPG
jgi:segregation and condensation protein B